MTILVTYASKHGATRGIATHIAATLRAHGQLVDLLSLSEVGNPEAYQAAIIGSALYFGSWMREATAFIQHHHTTLARQLVWLFSSGPLGGESRATEPEPKELAAFQKSIQPRDHRIFAGALDLAQLSFAERLVVTAIHAPSGDFRDWDAIAAWTMTIVHTLEVAQSALQAPIGMSTSR